MTGTKKERFIQAWKTVFDADEVKDDDNFFEVGGDSMKGVQLIGALAGYGLKLDMLKLYTQPTVEELVEAAEEMEPVEIPAEVMSGNLTGEEMKKYLEDPTIQKAMSEFGIRAEDILEKAGTSKVEDISEKSGPNKKETEPEESKAVPGTMQAGYLIPAMYYFIPASLPEGMNAQPFDAASFQGGMTAQPFDAASFQGNAQPFDAASFQGAAAFPQPPFPGAIPVMAYPVFMPWPYGTGQNPENKDSEEK